MAEESGAWVAVKRRDPPGYVIDMVDVGSGRTITLPLDRRSPTIWHLVSDLEGGLGRFTDSPGVSESVALTWGNRVSGNEMAFG